ncbi:hypothetical protein KO527_05080 [Pseudoalteromonas sp. C2R02]|uniref:hypothetical protein n=1 Tax=Pseudoalteromonas sp. C2R02 TaxID=2841565 RepID=UPI001C0A561E|nr:hypothetical protein [Pseudoalteromonas sp. C2R02]MBU2968720.1 hypothetical protein [Pseudoalteromonas sp. C2R02]
MSKNTMPIVDAIRILNAEKHEFNGSFKANCCGSMITKGNAFYSLMAGGDSSEVNDECCTRCLKKQAYFEYHQYDDFDPSAYLNAEN